MVCVCVDILIYNGVWCMVSVCVCVCVCDNNNNANNNNNSNNDNNDDKRPIDKRYAAQELKIYSREYTN